MLGLLAQSPSTAYELAKKMEQSIHGFWPRAQSKLYEEPQHLVAHGLAEARRDHQGKRPRVIYAITPSGGEALRAWLSVPGAGPVLEFEALLKVFFADQGSKEDLLLQINSMKHWAEETQQVGRKFLERYAQGEASEADLLPGMGLMSAFLMGHAAVVAEWAAWASREVESWPAFGRAAPTQRIFSELLKRAGGHKPQPE